jgi:hypothetical protein
MDQKGITIFCNWNGEGIGAALKASGWIAIEVLCAPGISI